MLHHRFTNRQNDYDFSHFTLRFILDMDYHLDYRSVFG